MSDFEMVDVKKMFKNKKVWIFAGVGAAAGGVALLLNRGKTGTEDQFIPAAGDIGGGSLYPDGGGGGGADISSALQTVQQSFIESLGEYDELQNERLTLLRETQTEHLNLLYESMQAQSEMTHNLVSEITQQMIASQESMARQYDKLSRRIEDIGDQQYNQPQSSSSSSSSSSSKNKPVTLLHESGTRYRTTSDPDVIERYLAKGTYSISNKTPEEIEKGW